MALKRVNFKQKFSNHNKLSYNYISKYMINMKISLTFLLVILLIENGSCSSADNFSFCIEKIHVTVIWQPLIMYKVLVRADDIDPVEVHPKNKWLKFFKMLLREFKDDECYDIKQLLDKVESNMQKY